MWSTEGPCTEKFQVDVYYIVSKITFELASAQEKQEIENLNVKTSNIVCIKYNKS